MDPTAYAAQQAYQGYDPNATYYSQQQNVGVPGQPAYPHQVSSSVWRTRLSYSSRRLQSGADPNVYPQQLPQPQPQAQGQIPPVMPDHSAYTAQPQPGQPQVRDHSLS